MRSIFVLFIIISLFNSLKAQSPYTGIFEGTVRSSQIIQSDGLFRFFTASDNQFRFGNTEKAILIMDNAIAEYPNFAEAYLKRSKLLANTGRTTEAKQDLMIANRLNPYLSGFYLTRKLGRLNYLAFDPDYFFDPDHSEDIHQSIQQVLEYKLSGNLHHALDQTLTLFNSMDEPSASIHTLKGNLYLLLDDYYNAVHHYSKAIQKDPDSGALFYNRAVARLFTYERNAACEDLEMSKSLGFERSEIKLKNFCTN